MLLSFKVQLKCDSSQILKQEQPTKIYFTDNSVSIGYWELSTISLKHCRFSWTVTILVTFRGVFSIRLNICNLGQNIYRLFHVLAQFLFNTSETTWLKKIQLAFCNLMVVLKQFQKNLFHMLCSLGRISWDTGVPLGGKGFFSLSLRIF